MFCHITENWRGRPLVSRAVVVNLIGGTTTKTGLHVEAALDTNSYAIGIKVTDEEFAQVRIKKHTFHGEWNYTYFPHFCLALISNFGLSAIATFEFLLERPAGLAVTADAG